MNENFATHNILVVCIWSKYNTYTCIFYFNDLGKCNIFIMLQALILCERMNDQTMNKIPFTYSIAFKSFFLSFFLGFKIMIIGMESIQKIMEKKGKGKGQMVGIRKGGIYEKRE